MHLSKRVRGLRPSSTIAVSTKVKAMKAAGVDVIGFGLGEPDFDTPDAIKHKAIEALQAGQTGYAPVPGPPEARDAIARKLRDENGIDCSADHVCITVGAKHALYLVMQCLLDPGEGQEVIVPTPAWVSYRPIVELAGGTVVEVPGSLDNDFRITLGQLQAALTPRTAAIIINSPSNPCGTMYSPAELRAFAEVLAQHPQVTIVTDEIYEKLIYGDEQHYSMGSHPAVAGRVVTINGLSKSYAMTGWRIGYLCAPGDDGALARAAAKLQGQMTSNITSFTYPALIEALTAGEQSVQSMRKVFAQRATLMYDLISQWPDVRCPRSTGAFYMFPDVSAYFGKTTPQGRTPDSALSLADALLEEARVGVVPGEDFGACAAGHIRLSFAASEDHIREGCTRIGAWLASLKAGALLAER